MELRFSITIWLSFFTTGWYVVTKDPFFPKTRPRTPIILDFGTSWLEGTREIRINLKMSPIIKK